MESIVVVAGPGSSFAEELRRLHGSQTLEAVITRQHGKVSCKEYGNFLPELWGYAKKNAIASEFVASDAFHQSVANKNWSVITSSISGGHRMAGSSSVVETYGSLSRAKCLRCGHESPMTMNCYLSLDEGQVPACLSCGKNRTRPDFSIGDEGMRCRRKADKLLRSANTIIYAGVDSHGPGPEMSWYRKVPYSVLVSETPWGSFDRHFEGSVAEWVSAGVPAH